MSKKYPTDIVMEDGYYRIHEGHGLDRQELIADYEEYDGIAPVDAVWTIEEVYLHYTPRIKWCEKVDGWGCDANGEWHGHWFEVMPAHDSAFTLVGWSRVTNG